MDTVTSIDSAGTSDFPPEKDTPERIAIQARDLTTRALEFLSNASNETLGACLVGLGAVTWLVLGRVGLVLIGMVGGIVLHATWEENIGSNGNDEARALEARKRREKGLDIAARVLEWKERREGSPELDGAPDAPVAVPLEKDLDFAGFPSDTRKALTDLVDSIIRDYVKWWYSPVLPTENGFPLACRKTLTGFLLAASNHLSRKRPADTFLEFLTNSSSIVIVFLSELSSAFKSPASSGSASESVRLYLEANPSSSLANVLDVEQQKKKLRAVSQDILYTFLDRKSYDCEPVLVFLREILASVVLDMTVTSCSRPEFINEWIIYSLEEGDTELLQAIDAGVGGATANGDVKNSVQASKGVSAGHIASTESSNAQSQAKTEHRRTVSRAEEAVDEAMQEAQRLSEMIAAEENKNQQASEESLSSGDTTDAVETPTSSRDDISTMANSSSSALAIDEKTATDAESKISASAPSFTTFDQILSSQQPTALRRSETQSYEVVPMSLHNAKVSIFDDSVPGEKGTLRSKPTAEYLLQIEPATSQHPGWMIARLYSDFETLHEVLRRISVISGVAAFAERHPTVPAWKNKTKTGLRSELESYLLSALSFQRLAESEGMKRFLEKDQGIGRSSPNAKQGGFGFPTPAAFETMGKGMLDVLASAPKGAAGGGKALLGGVTGILGGAGSIGQKRQTSKSPIPRPVNGSTQALSQIDNDRSAKASFVQDRGLQESPRPLISAQTENTKPPHLPDRPSPTARDHENDFTSTGVHPEGSQVLPEAISKDTVPAIPQQSEQDELHLPPPPSEIADDYNFSQASSRPSFSNDDSSTIRTSISTAPTTQASRSRKSTLSSIAPGEPTAPTSKPPPSTRDAALPLTGQETSIAVELFFAIINELYSLSSAWTLRLTLLNAAKSFLLRPGNPNLEAIRVLLQKTAIDANTSDGGIAAHLTKLRENALPTEEELKAWPPPPSEEAKERMRVKARKLLVEKGMPQALTSVMGAAASGEALGRVFDCLQVPEVARGLVFALVLQGVRAVTQ